MISEEIDLDHEGVKGLDGESEWDWRRDGVIRSATDGGTGRRGEREGGVLERDSARIRARRIRSGVK